MEKGGKRTPRKRYSIEQIIDDLREADVWLAQGRTVGEVCRHIGVSEQGSYRWRQISPAPKSRRGDGSLALERAAAGRCIGRLPIHARRVAVALTLKANNTDRNDEHGLAQLVRSG